MNSGNFIVDIYEKERDEYARDNRIPRNQTIIARVKVSLYCSEHDMFKEVEKEIKQGNAELIEIE